MPTICKLTNFVTLFKPQFPYLQTGEDDNVSLGLLQGFHAKPCTAPAHFRH